MSTILVIDDDSNNLRMLSYTLRKAGHAVLTASDGQQGLEILHQQPVQLAILDLSMPVMDGLSLLATIRSDQQLIDLPVIILTASGDDHDLAIAREIGMNGFLTKPSSSRTLLNTVNEVLAER